MRNKSPAATLVDLAKEVKDMQGRLAELEMFARKVRGVADDAANDGEKVSPSTVLSLCASVGVS